MDEIENLRRLLAEAENRAQKEQARREEEQRRREEAESHARDEQNRREEEQRRREEAESHARDEQHRREEEQRRREEAEQVATSARLQTLLPYLEACHSLSLAIQVVTDRSLTTQGDTTNPVGRIYPRQILPWEDFPTRQEEIWHKLSEPSFTLRSTFPSQHQLDYVQSLIHLISSEHGLRYFERDTVENAAQKLVDAVYEHAPLRKRLGLRGTVTFESHTNLGNNSLSESLQHLSITDASTGNHAADLAAAAQKASRRTPARGKGNRADQFCIYRTSDGTNIPAIAIEYKAPHKLSQEEVISGLVSEIQPERDVIDKTGDGFAFASKTLVAAVVTQLFSYMVGKGIRYGYVCTGQVFIFLHIPDDPAIVFYHVCVPNLDVLDDDDNRLHRTAVAQVFAFILQALRTPPPPQSWHDAAAGLGIWAVEYDDVLSRIPVSVRKEKDRRPSPYKPQRWHGFQRSPIRTRSHGCQPRFPAGFRDGDDGDDGDNEDEEASIPPSPAAERSTRSSGGGRGRDIGQASRRRRQPGKQTKRGIQDRPYCTHRCLLGIANGTAVDAACPNAHNHGETHIARTDFLCLLRTQLAQDRGPDADCTPLYLSGSVGSLFKIRLSACGYTLVAKGAETANLARLEHEERIYRSLRSIQGTHVPVCLGRINLALPLYCDGGVYKHLLLLSWAGPPLSRCIDQISERPAITATTEAFARLHQLRVLHGDAEPRNLLHDASSGTIMVTDFERSRLSCRRPLGPASPNGQNRKRTPGVLEKRATTDDFSRELQCVIESVSRRFRAG
jgi:hypothetical protein